MVIATGSDGPFPGKCGKDSSLANLIKRYEDVTNEIKIAKQIVIVGGGPVGVELAGEIVDTYGEEKQVS